MVYKQTYNNRMNTIPYALSFIIAMVTAIFVVNGIFLNKSNGEIYNSILYAKFLNMTMPVIRGTNYKDELVTEENISVKREAMKLLGIDIYNPLALMSKEISFFGQIGLSYSYNSNAETKSVMNIESFNLSNNELIQQNANNTNNNNAQQTQQNSNGNLVNTQNPSIKFDYDPNKPRVYIYHSHTHESYAGTDNEDFQSEDPNKNVCAVGDVIVDDLKTNYGIAAINDKTNNSLNYLKAYSTSRNTLQKALDKYKNFDIIIDLHRDAEYNRDDVTTKINGNNVSKIRFVMTKKNPHLNNNMEIVNSMIGISDKLFPGYCRGIYWYNYGTDYFNQDMSNNAFLLEVGAQISTADEAKNSGKYISRLIAEYLNSKR
ncbi:stage II sporulation protein P [Clostridium sp. 19966]|uniref:stage II sporulation protein P n=1 Tax=Clostridium sp. 19966 TaxID=2768166 RepID=UPI0028E06F79|nr:stage II sporulation protein P [Clostridium sp. 19966]MDT8715302.1 stage II sporulation protein P [Clostridium sp. 19966]